MKAKVRSTCGICGCSPTTGDRIAFSHLVSETKRAKYEGAERLELEMPLCALCRSFVARAREPGGRRRLSHSWHLQASRFAIRPPLAMTSTAVQSGQRGIS
jgi:hypothetical protein